MLMCHDHIYMYHILKLFVVSDTSTLTFQIDHNDTTIV